MNASLIIENQQLLHENKQINSLLKDYEQMLETVMAKFRAQAVRGCGAAYRHNERGSSDLSISLAYRTEARAHPHSPLRVSPPSSRK